MYDIYLITGATGYLGGTVVRRLTELGARVRALAMEGDALTDELPAGVEIARGAVDKKETLESFFADIGERACVIHCAGIVSIATRGDERLWRVNVEGTRNIVELCRERGAAKLIYVSSVHAIPEKPMGEAIAECGEFSPQSVVGAYARSKAAATEIVLTAARNGLNASVVHPSGIIGPYDRGAGSVTGTIISYCRGRLIVGVKGGYDFVDVRDVAEGIISCCINGGKGECYILSNRYASVKEILETLKKIINGRKILFYAPLKLAKLFAPICEKISIRRRKPLFLTPYSVYTLGVNSYFSREKAERDLNYHPRAIEETLKDMVRWLKETGRWGRRKRIRAV